MDNRSQVKWELPPRTFEVKLYGACKGNPGPSSAGFIVRDDTIVMILGGSIKLPVDTNTEAEFVALLMGLSTCRDRGLTILDIKGDSQVVVRAISCGSTTSWRVRMWTDAIKEILENLEDYSLHHIYREVNHEVDYLANHAIDQVEQSIIASDKTAWQRFFDRNH
ncbi:hypothetical protein SUGI_1063140 [Cryptomeria japonica]|nr:hypothetical protein SUGI_1063140 [Cryptomeria japonica]